MKDNLVYILLIVMTILALCLQAVVTIDLLKGELDLKTGGFYLLFVIQVILFWELRRRKKGNQTNSNE